MTLVTGAALWADVKSRYDEQALISLTNVRKKSATAIDDTVGEQAAQDVVDIFPTYAQLVLDDENPFHPQAYQHAIDGVISMLWRRGGVAAGIQVTKWDDWVQQCEAYRNTDARSHGEPVTDSTLQNPPKDIGPHPRIAWAHPRNFRGLLPEHWDGYGTSDRYW